MSIKNISYTVNSFIALQAVSVSCLGSPWIEAQPTASVTVQDLTKLVDQLKTSAAWQVHPHLYCHLLLIWLPLGFLHDRVSGLLDSGFALCVIQTIV